MLRSLDGPWYNVKYNITLLNLGSNLHKSHHVQIFKKTLSENHCILDLFKAWCLFKKKKVSNKTHVCYRAIFLPFILQRL